MKSDEQEEISSVQKEIRDQVFRDAGMQLYLSKESLNSRLEETEILPLNFI